MIITDIDFSECKNEQQFKMKYINNVLRWMEYNYVLPIETEETVRGFPDVMCLTNAGSKTFADFYEFKISDKSGKIKFQPTQPAFYKSHKDLNIKIIALNKKSGKVHNFDMMELFLENSAYKMNDKAEVNLNKGE